MGTGAGGPLSVERITQPHPTSTAFLEAATGLEYPVTQDFNGEQMEGVGYSHITTRNGKRASAVPSAIAPGSTPASWRAQPGALSALAMISRRRPNCSRSRTAGSRISSWS